MDILFQEFTNFSTNYISIGEQGSSGSSSFGNQYTEENYAKYKVTPDRYYTELIGFSRYLYNTSATYNKIINFYATLPTYSYTVDLAQETKGVNLSIIEKNYFRVLELLEKMSLRHELQKLMRRAYKEDVAYGYEMETNNSYYIKLMPFEHCKITSVEDGVFNYSFDFSIFEKDEELLNAYPKEFEKIFKEYMRQKNSKSRKKVDSWIELDSRKAFAIKINEDVEFPLPPFMTSMESALDEEKYRKIKQNKDLLDNFMTLIQHIPLNDDDQSQDAFRLSLKLAMQFHQQAESVLPEGIGLITSPMKIEAVKLEKSKRDDDLIMIAKDNTLSNAGLPPNIFSTTNKTSSGIKYAVKYLEQQSFAPLRQLERWINRKLKRLSGNYKFKLRFIDVTNYSRDEVLDRYLKAAQYGFPVKQEVSALLDSAPLNMQSSLLLENEILGLHETMIPVSSAHTQSSKTSDDPDKEVGRDEMKDEEVSEDTEVWRENKE